MVLCAQNYVGFIYDTAHDLPLSQAASNFCSSFYSFKHVLFVFVFYFVFVVSFTFPFMFSVFFVCLFRTQLQFIEDIKTKSTCSFKKL